MSSVSPIPRRVLPEPLQDLAIRKELAEVCVKKTVHSNKHSQHKLTDAFHALILDENRPEFSK
jgi:hypothetical protein